MRSTTRLFPTLGASVVVSVVFVACGRANVKTSSVTPVANAGRAGAAGGAGATAAQASAATTPSSRPALEPSVPARFRLRASEVGSPWEFHSASSQASRAAAAPSTSHADGCKASLRIAMHGYISEEPVRATLELINQKVGLRFVNVKTGVRESLQGTLEPGLCANPEPSAEATLSLRPRPGSSGAAYGCTLLRNSYFDTDRNRLRLSCNRPDEEAAIELWDTSPAQGRLLDQFQKVLMDSADIEAVVPGEGKTSYLAYLTLRERGLVLAELGGSPTRLVRKVATGLSCDLHECGADLKVFAVNPTLTVLVPTIAGENCGAKCSKSALGEVWSLTSSGFQGGARLPESSEMMGGIDYSGSSSSTSVSWVDGDGAEPLEMLVESSSSDSEKVSRRVLGFDAAAQAYSIAEELPELKNDSVEPFKRGAVVSY